MKSNTKYFIDQYKEHKEWEKKYNSRTINLNSYFKYSGKIEKSKSLYNFASYKGKWRYNENSRCYSLHEIITKKKKKDEKNKKNSGNLIKTNETCSGKKTENYIYPTEI